MVYWFLKIKFLVPLGISPKINGLVKDWLLSKIQFLVSSDSNSDKWKGPKMFGFGWFRRSSVSLRLVSEYFLFFIYKLLNTDWSVFLSLLLKLQDLQTAGLAGIDYPPIEFTIHPLQLSPPGKPTFGFASFSPHNDPFNRVCLKR